MTTGGRFRRVTCGGVYIGQRVSRGDAIDMIRMGGLVGADAESRVAGRAVRGECVLGRQYSSGSRRCRGFSGTRFGAVCGANPACTGVLPRLPQGTPHRSGVVGFRRWESTEGR